MQKKYVLLFAMLAFPFGSLFAEEKDTIEFLRPVLFMSQEGTRIVKGGGYINSPWDLNDAWILPTVGSVDFQVKKNERLGLEVLVAATYYTSPIPNTNFNQNQTRNISVTTPRVDFSYIFGDLARPLFKVDMGIFNYKYNEYARNLGEYAFRTWAYPGFIQTGGAYGYVGNNSATVTGLKISQTLGMFSHDFIASIETELTPIYDLNLTYMARFNYQNIFKIGAGVQFARVLSASDVPVMTSHYFNWNGTWYAGDQQGSGYYTNWQQGIRDRLNAMGVSAADSANLDMMGAAFSGAPVPPSANKKNESLSSADSARLVSEYIQLTKYRLVTDSVLFGKISPQMESFNAQAIKPIAYFSFDPKHFIRSNVFGAKDLVIYGEASILGTKTYPVYYTNIWRRTPVMFGFNFPTFKVLDVLSLEAEYYGSRWLPTYDASASFAKYNAIPVPFLDSPDRKFYYPADWDKDNWKWSVYAERALVKGVTFSAQAASDHSRTWDWGVFGKTPWELYTTPSQWYWALKLGVKI